MFFSKPYLRDEQPEKFKFIFEKFFQEKYKPNFPDSLLFKKWDKTKLPNNIKYIDSNTWSNILKIWMKKSKALDSIFMENDYTIDQALQIIDTNRLEQHFRQTWKEKIGKSFTRISYPYFNDSYTKAMIKINVIDGVFGGCSFGETPTYLIKENNKWRNMTNEELKLITEK